MSQEHQHEWIVFSTAVNIVSLLVRCECGAVGLVKAPTAKEWGRAFHAPSHPYPWKEPQRVEILEGWTTEKRIYPKGYNVVRRTGPDSLI